MKKDCNHKNPLQRDGSTQTERFRSALSPDFAELDNRTTEDFLAFAYRYAKHLKYFNFENQYDGNWEAFFEKINTSTLEEIETQANNNPHLVLFICFLKLFKFAQNQLNDLSGKHLDFYYKEVLQLKEKQETPDKIHLIFELAKNANQQMIEAGTRFKAGKDNTGIPLEYVAEEDTLLNKTSIELLRTIRRESNVIHFASVTNSGDGYGEEPLEIGTAWNAFGHSSLPIAAPGFALASPILELQEGTRKVILNFSLSSLENLTVINSRIKNGFEVFASGEEGWMGPFSLDSISNIKKVSGTNNNYSLQIIFTIPTEEEAVVAFDHEVLTGEFNTDDPVVRIILKDNVLFEKFEKSVLNNIQIEVDVNGIQTLSLENDFGKIDPAKPFSPFGAQPRRGSNFYIGSMEAFTKQLKSFKLNLRWQNLPSKFDTHYAEYPNLKNTNENSFKGKLQMLSGKNWNSSYEKTLFTAKSNQLEANHSININFSDNPNTNQKTGKLVPRKNKVVNKRYNHSHLKISQIKKEGYFYEDSLEQKKPSRKRRRRPVKNRRRRGRNVTRRQRREKSLQLSSVVKEGFIRLALSKQFGHKKYPSLYAVAISKKVETASTKLPNEPYTPTLEYLHLDYIATTNKVAMASTNTSFQNFDDREIQLFHLHPFGHTEEHPFLKQSLPFSQNTSINLLPQFQNEGEFYLGLSNTEPNQSVSILLQLEEGSANPELENQEVEWSVLSHNHWQKLDQDHFLADHTNQLLTSGVVKLILPKIASDDNTILDDGYYWLRIKVKNQTDAVSKFLGIHTQAVPVIFQNQNNGPEHLASALTAKTISKMVQRLPSVKKIEQPYDSFGGKTKESAEYFYTRVSERLRHKNRAVSIWDYEHLVLENFPEIYKAKCLNHTNTTNEFAPGNVYIIVIPNLKNRVATNTLQPKVSSNTLSEIENFLNQKNSMFVNTIAQNADYEEIRLEFKVAFKHSLEFGFYAQQLNEDLKKFLTPWAFDSEEEIHFGGNIHKSILLNFMDGLEYVNFITDLNMFHIDEDGIETKKLDLIETTSSRAILVSVATHNISQTTANTVCQ